MRRVLAIVVVVVVASVFAGCSASGGVSIATPPPGSREAAPDFTLANLKGGPQVRLSAYRGKPVLLNFWAYWCGPCVNEMPALQKFSQKYRDIAVLGVAVGARDAGKNRAFVNQHDIGYPVGVGSIDLVGSFKGVNLPHTVLLDREGRVIQTIPGPINLGDLAGIASAMRKAG
ncbi:MAG: TlpA disulfide reductase family protein [Thermoleophilia bacterium]